MKVYAESFGAKVSYFEDYGCNEIDAVVEMPNGEWSGFDIRLGAEKDLDKAAKEMLSIKKDIISNGGIAPSNLCIVTAMSTTAYVRKDGIMVVPITSLKN